ncbi:MAG: hypothetical protein IPK19_05160 [Chloroflexi bacterium]|nr:hypothetical protein [Chloroflexota bacterium]
MLDGSSIAEGVPLVSAEGYAALTVSQAAVRFTSAAIQGAAPETTFTGVSGDWISENGVITQRTAEMRDFLTTSGIQAERYIVSIDITLPELATSPDAGGGLVFHMGGRENLAGGHMVRFHRGGQELLWGWYDASGVFQYEAGQPLTLSDARTHTLTVNVRADQYDVAVDGTAVLNGIPLRSAGGWIGLLSFGGGVSFANFRLAITGET